MPTAGQSLQNPYTGDRIVFHKTGQDTGGELVEIDHYMPPRPMPAFPKHIHLNQEERFEILSGTARYSLNGVEYEAQAGETVIVPIGAVHHNCWNAGPGELHMRQSLRPGLNSEFFFESIFTLAQEGKTDRKGQVNLLQAAVIGSEIESETYIAAVPIFLQRMGLPVLAVLGRWLGYRARYP